MIPSCIVQSANCLWPKKRYDIAFKEANEDTTKANQLDSSCGVIFTLAVFSPAICCFKILPLHPIVQTAGASRTTTNLLFFDRLNPTPCCNGVLRDTTVLKKTFSTSKSLPHHVV